MKADRKEEDPALATPPAQPAPKGGDEVERLRDAVSLALQYLPAQPSGSDAQKDIARIHDLIAGKAVAWDKAHVSESPSTHGKPLQPGWLKDQLDKAAGRAAAMPSWMTHPGESTHGKPDGAVRWTRVNDEPFEYAIQQGEHGDEFVKLLDGSCLRRAALLAAETSPGDVRTESSKQYRDAVDSVNRSTDREIADALAMKEASKRAVTATLLAGEARLACAAIDRIDVKAEAKSQEPEAVLTVPFNPCLAKLREGEPFFVLLGRDKQAPLAVATWADARESAEGKSAWTDQAREVAASMADYSGAKFPTTKPAVSAGGR